MDGEGRAERGGVKRSADGGTSRATRGPADPRTIICDGTVRRIRYYFNWNPFDWRLHRPRISFSPGLSSALRLAPSRSLRQLVSGVDYRNPFLISEGIFNSQSRERSAATKIMVSRPSLSAAPPPLPASLSVSLSPFTSVSFSRGAQSRMGN